MAGPLQLRSGRLAAEGVDGLGVRRRRPATGRPSERRRGAGRGPRRRRRPARGGPLEPRRGSSARTHTGAPGASWPRRSRSARDDDREDRVAAGRLVVDEEDDGPPVRRELDRPGDDAVGRELARPGAPGIGSPSRRSPTRSLVGLTVQGVARSASSASGAEVRGVRAGEDAERVRRRDRGRGRHARPVRVRGSRGRPAGGQSIAGAGARVHRARRSRRRAPSSASRGRPGRRCRPGPRGSRGRRSRARVRACRPRAA